MMSGSKSNDTRKGAQHVSGKAPAPAAASATPTTEASAGDNGTRGGSGRMAMQISSDEINVLIYRYLQEAGTLSDWCTSWCWISTHDVSKRHEVYEQGVRDLLE